MSKKSDMKKSALQRLSHSMSSIITNADLKRKRFSPVSKQMLTKRIKLKPEPTSLFSRFSKEGANDIEINNNQNNNTFNFNYTNNNENDKLKPISKMWIPPLKTNNIQQVDKLNNINSENINIFKDKSKQKISKLPHLSKTTSTTVKSENNDNEIDSFILTNTNVEQMQEVEKNDIYKCNNTKLEGSSDYLTKELKIGSSSIETSVVTLQDADTIMIDADNDNCTGQLKSENNYLYQTVIENEKGTNQIPSYESEYFINSDNSKSEILDINFKETKIEFDKASNQNDLLIINKNNDDVKSSSCIKIIAEVDESARKIENINDKVDKNGLINESNNNVHKNENNADGSLIDKKNVRTDSEIVTIKKNAFEEMKLSQKLKNVPSDYDISNKSENNHNIVHIDLTNDENIGKDLKINSPEIDFEQQINENIEKELEDTVLISNEAEDDSGMNEGSISNVNFTLNSQDMTFKGDDDSIQDQVLTSNDSNTNNSLKEVIENSQTGSITCNEFLHDVNNYDGETEVPEKYSDVINNELQSISTIHDCEKDMIDHDKINDDTAIPLKNNKKEKYNINKANKSNPNDLLTSSNILTEDNKNIFKTDNTIDNFSKNLDLIATSNNTQQVKENNLEISDERNLESYNDPEVISLHSGNSQSQENLSGFKDNCIEIPRELDENNSLQTTVIKQENYDEYIKCNDDFYSIPMSEIIRIENEYKQTETNNEPKDYFSNENNNTVPATKINNFLQNNSTDQTFNQNLPCGSTHKNEKVADFLTPLPTIPPPKLDWLQRVNQEKQKIRSIIQEINQLNSIVLQARKEIWPNQFDANTKPA